MGPLFFMGLFRNTNTWNGRYSWDLFCFRNERNSVPFILSPIGKKNGIEFNRNKRNCVLSEKFSE